MPIPRGLTGRLAALGRSGWSEVRSLDICSEGSHAFALPAVLQVKGASFEDRVEAWSAQVAETRAALDLVQLEIDELCFELYGISDEDRVTITDGFGVTEADEDERSDDSEDVVKVDPSVLAFGLVSWAVGVVVGRFDVRLATGEREWPVEPDPFDALPVCSPGMLTGEDGLPLDEPPAGYPVGVSSVL
ncbi:BREX-1 system adenine-specific DNA-methyltransferase PglX, partial [Acidimicrobiales bacterium]|nr:BREX-1 system adenine-specific DNA-methyltransferase PglX [Acidimicrobiales bacterium]